MEIQKVGAGEQNILKPSVADDQSLPDAEDEDGGTEANPSATTKKKKKKKKLICNLTLCKYEIISDAVQSLGWVLTSHESKWDLFWTDMSVGEERCMRLQRGQKLNHFPGMQVAAALWFVPVFRLNQFAGSCAQMQTCSQS